MEIMLRNASVNINANKYIENKIHRNGFAFLWEWKPSIFRWRKQRLLGYRPVTNKGYKYYRSQRNLLTKLSIKNTNKNEKIIRYSYLQW
jgi:hypothetical protein